MIKKIFGYLYMGFYGIVFIGVFILLYPLLWVLLSRESTYYYADKIRKFWAHVASLLTFMFPDVRYQERLDARKQYVFCANHMSYLDIVLMGGFLPTFNFFMAKMELSKIPLFNIWFKTIDVPVKRESLRNSHEAFFKVGQKLDKGASLIIFPEGRIPDNAPVMKYPLKLGAFKLAIEKGIPVVPVTIFDTMNRFNVVTNLMTPGKMSMKVHEPIQTTNLTLDDAKMLAEKVYSIINQELIDAKIV